MSIKRVSDIKPKDSPKPIEVRLIKRWTPYSSDPEKKNDPCFLFVDIHGDAIEATAAAKHEEHFNSLLQLQNCYKIDGYVCIPSRGYMPMVPHEASLKLGKRATFQLVDNIDIPTFYYNFATYEDLPSRRLAPRMLTDYIGRIEHVTPILTRQGKKMRKVTIRDERNNVIEVTLWEEKKDLIQPEGAKGKALVVTSTTVTLYNKLQLETMVSSTVEVNPNFPQLQTYLDRFKNLGDIQDIDMTLRHVTIAEVLKMATDENMKRGQFLCKASITAIHERRGWFYVNCSVCNNKAYPQENTFVCDDDVMSKEPIFMYCIHTTIKDHSGTTEATFFNDSINNILNISCRDMVMVKKNFDQKLLPNEVRSISGIPLLLTINIKNDGSVGVDNAQKAPTHSPTTPDPKNTAAKRTTNAQTGPSTRKESKRCNTMMHHEQPQLFCYMLLMYETGVLEVF